jgi:hypothetical protein
MAVLVLKGNLKLGADSSSETDVSDEILSFTISAERDLVTVPPTLATPKVSRAGTTEYFVEIGYLSTDDDTTSVFQQMWTALGSAAGTMYFEGSFTDAVVSATNPLWSGTFVVVGAGVGGDAEGLSQFSARHPLTAAPTRAVV